MVNEVYSNYYLVFLTENDSQYRSYQIRMHGMCAWCPLVLPENPIIGRGKKVVINK